MAHLKAIDKVAILLMKLQSDKTRSIFHYLDPDEINSISLAMTRLGVIDSDTVEKVILEFLHDFNQSLNVVGNPRTTEKLLKKILDDEKYKTVLDKIKDSNTNTIWEMIDDLDDNMIAQFIKGEYPQTAALILAKIPSYKASRILKLLSKEYATEVLVRMMHLDAVQTETLQNLEKVLEAELLSKSKQFKLDDNSKVVIDIFNNFNKEDEQYFMKLIQEKDPLFANKVAQSIITMEDLLLIDDNGIQNLIKNLDNNTIIIGLAGASKAIQELLIRNMSQRIARIVEDEISIGSKYSRKEIAEAQIRIIKIVKNLIRDGLIILEKNLS